MTMRSLSNSHLARSPHGFATALVVWAVALSVLVLSATQLAAWRQAADGREALARVRARWAARAGVEAVVARLQAEFDAATPLGARSLLSALAAVSQSGTGKAGMFAMASFEVSHDEPATGARVLGPGDAHAKINVNLATSEDLMLLPNMTEDAAGAILDWIDTDEDANSAGAEAESYLGLPNAYAPRNGPVPDLGELELVLGVRREFLYGADPTVTGPIRSAAAGAVVGGATDASAAATSFAQAGGWARFLTASSLAGGLTPAGDVRIDLATAAATDIVSAVGVDQAQARAIATHAAAGGSLADFIRTNLSTLAQQSGGGAAGGGAAGAQRPPSNLTRDELVALLNECTVGDATRLNPGKLNINTADDETMQYLATLTPTMRDAIVLYRDSAGGDVESVADLLDVPQMTPAMLADLFPFIDVRSNVFTMRSVGRDSATGLAVEIFAEVDRSTNPVTIRLLVAR